MQTKNLMLACNIIKQLSGNRKNTELTTFVTVAYLLVNCLLDE